MRLVFVVLVFIGLLPASPLQAQYGAGYVQKLCDANTDNVNFVSRLEPHNTSSLMLRTIHKIIRHTGGISNDLAGAKELDLNLSDRKACHVQYNNLKFDFSGIERYHSVRSAKCYLSPVYLPADYDHLPGSLDTEKQSFSCERNHDAYWAVGAVQMTCRLQGYDKLLDVLKGSSEGIRERFFSWLNNNIVPIETVSVGGGQVYESWVNATIALDLLKSNATYENIDVDLPLDTTERNEALKTHLGENDYNVMIENTLLGMKSYLEKSELNPDVDPKTLEVSTGISSIATMRINTHIQLGCEASCDDSLEMLRDLSGINSTVSEDWQSSKLNQKYKDNSTWGHCSDVKELSERFQKYLGSDAARRDCAEISDVHTQTGKWAEYASENNLPTRYMDPETGDTEFLDTQEDVRRVLQSDIISAMLEGSDRCGSYCNFVVFFRTLFDSLVVIQRQCSETFLKKAIGGRTGKFVESVLASEDFSKQIQQCIGGIATSVSGNLFQGITGQVGDVPSSLSKKEIKEWREHADLHCEALYDIVSNPTGAGLVGALETYGQHYLSEWLESTNDPAIADADLLAHKQEDLCKELTDKVKAKLASPESQAVLQKAGEK